MQSALAGVEGVESAKVEMPGTATVVGEVEAEVLIAAVEEAGFKAECPKCDKEEEDAAEAVVEKVGEAVKKKIEPKLEPAATE